MTTTIATSACTILVISSIISVLRAFRDYAERHGGTTSAAIFDRALFSVWFNFCLAVAMLAFSSILGIVGRFL